MMYRTKLLALMLGLAAFLLAIHQVKAADNAVIVTPGTGVTMKSKDVGSGVQAMQPIISDASGNALGTAANPLVATPVAVTTGGATPYHLAGGTAASTNATLISTGAHTLYTLIATNPTATPACLRMYD